MHRITHQQVTRTGLLHPPPLALQISSIKIFIQVAYIDNAPAYQAMLRSTDLSIFQSMFQGGQPWCPLFSFSLFFFFLGYFLLQSIFQNQDQRKAQTQIRDSDLW